MATATPTGGMKSAELELDQLHAHPMNANVCDKDVLDKLERNIKRSRTYPPLVVRPLTKKEGGGFQIIDGHHRKMVLERLGYTKALCVVWDVTAREADVALATLNRLHGTDDPRKRAQLLDHLNQTIPLEQLAGIMPENLAELEDSLKMLKVDFDALEALSHSMAERNDAETPVKMEFLVYPGQEQLIRRALGHIKSTELDPKAKNPDGQALEFLASEYLNSVQQPNPA
jgi:ParB-like chromosome segregation protein Spo0J